MKKYILPSLIIVCVFAMLSFVTISGMKIAEQDYLYSIICTENGEVVFEKENQERSFGFDGLNRQLDIYEEGRHVKTITLTDNTICEASYITVNSKNSNKG